MAVVDKDDAVANKDLILDSHAGTDEGVARDLAALADARVRLHFDESPDARVAADFASVKIHEGGDPHAATQPHVGRDARLVGNRIVHERQTRISSSATVCPRRIEALAASRTATTCRPLRPSVSGVARLQMQSTKC